MRARRVAVVGAGPMLAAFLLPSCGGGDTGQSPSAVATPAAVLGPVSLNIVSGETQAPVAGARMVVGGTEYVADAEGRVSLPGGLSAAAPADVIAAGFLDRQTMLSQRGLVDRLTLWPRQSATGLTEFFTTEVVYTSSAIGDEGAAPGGVALHRWADGVTQVSVNYLGPADNPAYRAFDEGALAIQRAAVDEINDVVGGRIGYGAPTAGPAPGAAARVSLRIYPAFEPCVASPANWGIAEIAEGAYTSATITYCRQDAPRDLGLTVHEFGHTVGLRHSSRSSDVMAPFARRTNRLSARERLVVQLMLQRPSGNRFPDNDRTARTTAGSPRAVACTR